MPKKYSIMTHQRVIFLFLAFTLTACTFCKIEKSRHYQERDMSTISSLTASISNLYESDLADPTTLEISLLGGDDPSVEIVESSQSVTNVLEILGCENGPEIVEYYHQFGPFSPKFHFKILCEHRKTPEKVNCYLVKLGNNNSVKLIHSSAGISRKACFFMQPIGINHVDMEFVTQDEETDDLFILKNKRKKIAKDLHKFSFTSSMASIENASRSFFYERS